MRRLLLVRHAPTPATRGAVFAGDEPLDEGGARQASSLRGRLARHGECAASPAACARETARLMGLEARSEPALAECAFGSWTGRSAA